MSKLSFLSLTIAGVLSGVASSFAAQIGSHNMPADTVYDCAFGWIADKATPGATGEISYSRSADRRIELEFQGKYIGAVTFDHDSENRTRTYLVIFTKDFRKVFATSDSWLEKDAPSPRAFRILANTAVTRPDGKIDGLKLECRAREALASAEYVCR